jgi:polyisoprenyl-phosphate glycosyltransferase
MKDLGTRWNSGARSAVPELSIVVPAFNEQGNIIKLYGNLQQALAGVDIDWDLVVVDDGSRDGTWSEIETLSREHDNVSGVRFSRNFGQQAAILAGLTYSRGRAAITMDADHQHPASALPAFIAEWRKGLLVVNSLRNDAHSIKSSRRFVSRIFHHVFSRLSGIALEPGTTDFRLLDRQVIDELLRLGEADLFLRGLVQWLGYPASTIYFDCEPRHVGVTKYNLRNRLRFAWSGISSFSIVPLRLVTLLGLSTSGLALLFVLYGLISKWLVSGTVTGWTSIVTIMAFLFSLLFLSLAVMAEYLGRLLLEVRGRPSYVVRQQVGGRPEAGMGDRPLDDRPGT